jgi:hypothetical protein
MFLMFRSSPGLLTFTYALNAEVLSAEKSSEPERLPPASTLVPNAVTKVRSMWRYERSKAAQAKIYQAPTQPASGRDLCCGGAALFSLRFVAQMYSLTLAFEVGPNGVASALVGLGLFGGGGLSSAFGSMILAHSSYQTLWYFFAAGTVLMFLFVATQKRKVNSPARL